MAYKGVRKTKISNGFPQRNLCSSLRTANLNLGKNKVSVVVEGLESTEREGNEKVAYDGVYGNCREIS